MDLDTLLKVRQSVRTMNKETESFEGSKALVNVETYLSDLIEELKGSRND